MLRGAHIIFVTQPIVKGPVIAKVLVGLEDFIPNTINADFHPAEQVTLRRQCNLPIDKLLLFGSLKATDPRKGIDYLMEASRILKEKHPDLATRIGIVVVGNRADQILALFPFRSTSSGYVSDENKWRLPIMRGGRIHHAFVGGQPAQYHRGGPVLRGFLRRIPASRHTGNDRPP